MKEQQCRFCPTKLQTFNEVRNHYDKVHSITEDNNPTFQSSINTISRDSKQMFVEYCEYCKSPPFFNSEVKSDHYLRHHLKLLPASKRDILIQKIRNRFLEFSINNIHHSKAYDFMNPDKVINEFIRKCCSFYPKSKWRIQTSMLYCKSICCRIAWEEALHNS